MPNQEKRQRLDIITGEIQSHVDGLISTSIPALVSDIDACDTELTAINAEIAALVAVANRNATQNADLRALRRDKTITQRQKKQLQESLKQARFSVRIARYALLLDGSRARESDISGSDG